MPAMIPQAHLGANLGVDLYSVSSRIARRAQGAGGNWFAAMRTRYRPVAQIFTFSCSSTSRWIGVPRVSPACFPPKLVGARGKKQL